MSVLSSEINTVAAALERLRIAASNRVRVFVVSSRKALRASAAARTDAGVGRFDHRADLRTAGGYMARLVTRFMASGERIHAIVPASFTVQLVPTRRVERGPAEDGAADKSRC